MGMTMGFQVLHPEIIGICAGGDDQVIVGDDTDCCFYLFFFREDPLYFCHPKMKIRNLPEIFAERESKEPGFNPAVAT